ncbi:hypothetical protein IC757_14070 [Wenzhouxiangella sp. AB-CW3]|uniref:hypothetical protein n=1 Tax=Wenzhouxiangella sp. AB-CW3 TaxID=2771012 RepID=UPI00168BC9B5|nr:hypothetical protein [Wenzhouxiangella sp. AB-CW3]QOC22133.1 hypothetical protein IC757_14070 [Wenzhouxiangella sp. AB-CW3]
MKTVLLAGLMLAALPCAHAGVFIFAEGTNGLAPNANLITHPTGYTGADNQHLSISVCIHPDSESKTELEIPVRNSITVWNQFTPTQGNVNRPDPELDVSEVDAESVLLHEVGHCIGLAHPNLASESGLSGSDAHYAKTLEGPNDVYDLDPGADQVIGTRDDQRGDDLNLNWFHESSNDPFSWPATIDGSTYSVDVSDLPTGHEFVEIAGWDVWDERELDHTIAVMFQGITNSETRRELNHDDAAMIRLAMGGTDRTQGTAKDYTYELEYGGVDDDCDITVKMTGQSFGVCQVSATSISTNHFSISSAEIELGSTSEFNWHFNTELLEEFQIFHDRFEQE